ncbi:MULTISPECIES: DUF305 domain-containing protein [unclassified Devosia]|uniref:DUF305 domain-containing protein n=1 Tax=unclassified Devosia TaxID=196773 RepID=UPI001AD0FEDF|nr:MULTISPECIES: DUF305 domain-containing protein [unclassified Devosia]MBN9360730.1 DUF305 domain-containing protein [Devosia sp.]
MKLVVASIVAISIGFAAGLALRSPSQLTPVVHDMNMEGGGISAQLESKSGEEFERAFIDEMIVHHESAVAMARLVLQKTGRPELMQLANDIISAQTREINMMRGWEKQWFNNNATSSAEQI